MSGKSSKHPRSQTKIETCSVKLGEFSMFFCLRRQSGWWKCRRPFPKTDSSSGTVEEIIDAPVPQAEEELTEVFRVFSQDRTQERTVKQINPAVPLAEKIVELPVIQTEEKTRQGVNACVQHVANAVEVEKPKIIELTVQRKTFIIQEKTNRVIEFPQAQFLDKAGDIPVVVQRQVSTAQTVQKAMEVPLSQFTDKVVDDPVVAQRQISVETVQKSIETPQLQDADKVVDVPVVLVAQVSHVHVVAKTPEIPQLQITDKVIDVPVVSAMQVPRVCAVKKTAETQLPLVRKIGVIPETIEIQLGINSESSVGSTQQQQAGQTEEERTEEGERRKGERGKEKERDAEEQECKQVKKDATGWTVVTRNKRQRKMVQIFVKVDETPMDVSLTDGKIEDVIRQVQKGEDVYVTMQGRVLRRNEKLKSCGVTDGCMIQVTSRMRGGGKHKDKKSKVEKKQGMKQEPQKNDGPAILESEKEAVIQMLEDNEEYRKIMDDVSGGSDEDMEWKMRYWVSKLRERPGADILECGLRWAVEARRKGRDKEQEQRRQAQQRQEPSKQGKQVRFGEEQQLGKTGAENTGEPEVMGRTIEVRTGRGSTGLVRGGDERCRADETSKGKGKGNGGKGEHEGKGGGFGHSGKQQEMREREEERVRMAPNMEAGGSHPQATSDPGEEQAAEGEQQRNEEKEEILKLLKGWQEKETSPIMRWAWADESTEEESNQENGEEKKETRGMSWADCEDHEGEKDEEEQETAGERQEEARQEEQEGDRKKEAEEKKEQGEGARQREMTDERPPGLEPKTQGEEQSQAESKQEAQEKESRRAQEAREDEENRAQEAREEERRVQEAHEEERRAQEAREEQKRAQEARKEQRRAQEAREKETRAQKEQEERINVQEEQVEAQEGHEEAKEVTTQEKCVGAKTQTNSMCEENDVSNRHMTWWRNAWWIRVDSGPHMRTARGRRRIWRAARRAAEQARDEKRVEETQSFAEEAEGEKWGRKERRERQNKQCSENTLHIVLHLANATTPTTAAAAATAAMRLQ